MVYNLNISLLKLDGTVLQEPSNGKLEDITLRTIISNSLQSVLPTDRNMGMVEKEKMFSLLLRVHSSPVMEFTEDEVKKLKERIAQMHYSILVVGQVLRMLDGLNTGLELLLTEGEVPVEDLENDGIVVSSQ